MEFLARAPWLNVERVTAYAWILVGVSALAAVSLVSLSENWIDPNGKPLGTDFMTVWSAGKLALAGNPAAAYDYALHFEVQRQALPWAADQTVPYYGWHYPPFFMFIAAGLALLPYGAALSVWTAATLPAYLAAVRAIAPGPHWALFALAFPAVLVNLGHGQSGFLTAGLLGFGLLLLERRPVCAGVLFGLLAYKPQLGLLLPLVLLMDRRWATFITAAATALGASLLSVLVFGAEVWRAFLSSVGVTRSFVLETGAMGWEKLQSTFGAMRLLGAGLEPAYAAQASVSLGVALAVLWVWRQPVTSSLKYAALVTGTLLATPYVMDYDLTLLALPIAWLTVEGLRTRFLDWEKIALFGAGLLPLVSRTIGALGVPTAPIILLLLLAVIVRRAASVDMSGTQPVAQPS